MQTSDRGAECVDYGELIASVVDEDERIRLTAEWKLHESVTEI